MEDDLKNSRITFLNVGTRILLKDTMDQYVRTLGDYKTHYAPTMSSALRTFQENTVHVLLSEVELEDGSAFRLIKGLGGADAGDDDLYVILALEEKRPELLALAAEMEVHAIMVKPFAAADLKNEIEKYRFWRSSPKDPWRALVHEALLCARDKRFREAETNLKEAIKAAPGNPAPLHRAGMYYLKKPDYAVAEVLLLKAVELKPDYTQAISALGTLYLAKGQLDKAEKFFERAHQLSPLNPDRLVEMVHLYLNRCIESCKNSLRLDQSNAAGRVVLGKLMAATKDYVGTIREIERALPALQDDAKAEAQTFIALARKLGGLAK